MKKYIVFLILLFFWFSSIAVVIYYNEENKQSQRDTLEDSFEIPVKVRKNISISYKNKPFAHLIADLVPNRFQDEMLYYLHITAVLVVTVQGDIEDIATKGYFLFKSTYELVRFNIDINSGYEPIKLFGRTGKGFIQLTAETKRTGTRIFQIRIPVVIWKNLISTVFKGTKQMPLVIGDDYTIFGDYRISFNDTLSEEDLVPIKLETLGTISGILEKEGQ